MIILNKLVIAPMVTMVNNVKVLLVLKLVKMVELALVRPPKVLLPFSLSDKDQIYVIVMELVVNLHFVQLVVTLL